ncbi:hypothetical protein Hanom_Chr09g00775361 [Helianthus anomalus]
MAEIHFEPSVCFVPPFLYFLIHLLYLRGNMGKINSISYKETKLCMDLDNHYITFHYFKASKTFSLFQNLHQPFFIYTQITIDVHLYPQSPEKNLLRYSKSPEKINDRRRSSTVTGEFQRSPPEIISLKMREFQVRRFFVDFCSGVSLCMVI